MNTMFKIADLISTDIRSRANADIIRSAIDGIKENIVLDFSGVTFVSRSFTDELYNVMKENKNISLVNMSDFVKSMLEAVTKGRNSIFIAYECSYFIRFNNHAIFCPRFFILATPSSSFMASLGRRP